MDKTWAELSPEQQAKITKGAADFLGEEGEPHWIAMGQGSRESWLWNDEHPTEARGAYEAELRRVADRADPATNGAFGRIVSYPPAVDLFAEDEPKSDIAYVRLRDRIMTPEAVKALPEPEWLIKGLLVKNTLALLWGPWNAGKTFLSLAWAGFVGSGSWWLGREVAKTKVLYVAGEGVAGLGNRIRAFEHGHHLFGMPGVDFHHGRINLLDPGEMVALAEVVTEGGYGLIVWDTLARMLPGADENSTREMSAVVDALDGLRFLTGCGSLALHHGTKEGTSARGVSPYLGACDTELKLTADEELMTLQCLQQRDGERPDDLRLWREIVPNTKSATIVDGSNRTPAGSSALEQAIAKVLQSARGTPFTLNQITSSVGCPRTSGQRGLDALVQQGFVTKGAHGITKTYTWN